MTGKRLNQMRFCLCKHGQSAHRNGQGPCFGERMFRGSWTPCTCDAFDPEPDPEAEPEGYVAANV